MTLEKSFKCFISSPGDCVEEREACQKVIDKINNNLAKHLGVNLKTFMWEYDVLPDMGRNGQEIIDEYIKKSEYDIFIGIMKNRFGHPTKKAGSGTEHEFNDALIRKTKSDDSLPQIIFFFGKENVDPNNFDFEQFQKVKDFKTRIGGEGLYVSFEGLSKFEDLLEKNLNLFIKENATVSEPEKIINEVDLIEKRLNQDLANSLRSYNEEAPVWVEPILSSNKDIPEDPNKNIDYKIELNKLIEFPEDVIIKAPSEFGMTSLAHYLKLQAWKSGKIFLYIDSKKTKTQAATKGNFGLVNIQN